MTRQSIVSDMRRRSSISLLSIALAVSLLCLLRAGPAQGEFYIEVRNSDNTTFKDYSDESLFTRRFAHITWGGIEGHLFLPTPANACSYIEPPPGGFPANSTWIALVYDYPSCPSDMVMNVRNAGYKLIIASNDGDSHRRVSKEVSDSLFPIAIVREEYADYLKNNATSNSTDDPILVFVKGSIISSVIVVTLSCFTGWICCCCCCCLSFVCCCKQRNRDGDIERRLQEIEERRRNFEQQQRHERLARQELIQSILRQLQELQLDLRVQIPLGEEETQRLPVTSYNAKKETSDTCAICVDEFIEEDQVRVLPCSHIFHPQCIDEWLGNHSSLCPLCKKEVPRQGRSESQNVTASSSDEDSDESTPSMTSDRGLLLPQGQRERSEQQVLYGSL